MSWQRGEGKVKERQKEERQRVQTVIVIRCNYTPLCADFEWLLWMPWLINNAHFVTTFLVLLTASPQTLSIVLQAQQRCYITFLMISLTFLLLPTCWNIILSVFWELLIYKLSAGLHKTENYRSYRLIKQMCQFKSCFFLEVNSTTKIQPVLISSWLSTFLRYFFFRFWRIGLALKLVWQKQTAHVLLMCSVINTTSGRMIGIGSGSSGSVQAGVSLYSLNRTVIYVSTWTCLVYKTIY